MSFNGLPACVEDNPRVHGFFELVDCLFACAEDNPRAKLVDYLHVQADKSWNNYYPPPPPRLKFRH